MRPRLADFESLLVATAQLVRNVMVDLRPPGLDELGLVAALNEHARRVASRGGFAVTVTGAEASPRLPPASEITLFRIAADASPHPGLPGIEGAHDDLGAWRPNMNSQKDEG